MVSFVLDKKTTYMFIIIIKITMQNDVENIGNKYMCSIERDRNNKRLSEFIPAVLIKLLIY